MSPQEAIEVLQKNYPSECYEDLREAVNEAIEALSKQSASSEQADKKPSAHGYWLVRGEVFISHNVLNEVLDTIIKSMNTEQRKIDSILTKMDQNDEAIRKDDHIADGSKMVDQFRDSAKKTDDVLLSRNEVIKAVDRHTRDDGTLDDDISCILEEVPLLEAEKSNSFSKEPSEDSDSEMNCSDEWRKNYIRSRMSRDDVPDTNVEKIPYKKPEIISCESCKHWTHTPLKGYGLGRCDVHDADLMTRYGSCGSAERRNDG